MTTRAFCDGIDAPRFPSARHREPVRHGLHAAGAAGRTGAGRGAGPADSRCLADLPVPARRAEHHRHARPEARTPRPSFAASSGRSPPTSPASRSCEHLPRSARQMDKFSLIRSFRHHNSDHGPADHYMLTGYFPQAGFNPVADAEQPTAGARLDHRPQARAARRRAAVRLPAEACTPAAARPTSARRVRRSSSTPTRTRPNFAVPDIVPPPALAAESAGARRELLRQLDRYQQTAEAQANQHARAVSDSSARRST